MKRKKFRLEISYTLLNNNEVTGHCPIDRETIISFRNNENTRIFPPEDIAAHVSKNFPSMETLQVSMNRIPFLDSKEGSLRKYEEELYSHIAKSEGKQMKYPPKCIYGWSYKKSRVSYSPVLTGCLINLGLEGCLTYSATLSGKLPVQLLAKIQCWAMNNKIDSYYNAGIPTIIVAIETQGFVEIFHGRRALHILAICGYRHDAPFIPICSHGFIVYLCNEAVLRNYLPKRIGSDQNRKGSMMRLKRHIRVHIQSSLDTLFDPELLTQMCSQVELYRNKTRDLASITSFLGASQHMCQLSTGRGRRIFEAISAFVVQAFIVQGGFIGPLQSSFTDMAVSFGVDTDSSNVLVDPGTSSLRNAFHRYVTSFVSDLSIHDRYTFLHGTEEIWQSFASGKGAFGAPQHAIGKRKMEEYEKNLMTDTTPDEDECLEHVYKAVKNSVFTRKFPGWNERHLSTANGSANAVAGRVAGNSAYAAALLLKSVEVNNTLSSAENLVALHNQLPEHKVGALLAERLLPIMMNFAEHNGGCRTHSQISRFRSLNAFSQHRIKEMTPWTSLDPRSADYCSEQCRDISACDYLNCNCQCVSIEWLGSIVTTAAPKGRPMAKGSPGIVVSFSIFSEVFRLWSKTDVEQALLYRGQEAFTLAQHIQGGFEKINSGEYLEEMQSQFFTPSYRDKVLEIFESEEEPLEAFSLWLDLTGASNVMKAELMDAIIFRICDSYTGPRTIRFDPPLLLYLTYVAWRRTLIVSHRLPQKKCLYVRTMPDVSDQEVVEKDAQKALEQARKGLDRHGHGPIYQCDIHFERLKPIQLPSVDEKIASLAVEEFMACAARIVNDNPWMLRFRVLAIVSYGTLQRTYSLEKGFLLLHSLWQRAKLP